ncbi:hypothetical protein DF186_15345, partial [Enterococcus hirae]
PVHQDRCSEKNGRHRDQDKDRRPDRFNPYITGGPFRRLEKAAGQNFEQSETGKNQRHQQLGIKAQIQSPVLPAAKEAIT